MAQSSPLPPKVLHAVLKTDELKTRFLDAPKFLLLCEQCPRFGRLWSCPPYAARPLALLDDLPAAHIVGLKLDVPQSVRAATRSDASARKAYIEQLFADVRPRFDAALLALEESNPAVLSLHAGACRFCPEGGCARLSGASCRHPERMRYSLESLGFDVSAIAQVCLKTSLLWAKDELPVYFLLVGALFSPAEIPDIFVELGLT